MIVTESDIYFAILNKRDRTPDYAKLGGTPGYSEDLVTPDHSHDDIKVTLREIAGSGKIDTPEGIPGREENVGFKFFLTSWGEEAMAPLADLGRATTLDD